MTTANFMFGPSLELDLRWKYFIHHGNAFFPGRLHELDPKKKKNKKNKRKGIKLPTFFRREKKKRKEKIKSMIHSISHTHWNIPSSLFITMLNFVDF